MTRPKLLRAILRNTNAWLGACVVVLCLGVIQTAIERNEARAALAEAQEKAEKMERAALTRKLETHENCRTFGRGGRDYRVCRIENIAGDS